MRRGGLVNRSASVPPRRPVGGRDRSPAGRDPEIPPGVTARELDRSVQAQLASLPPALQGIVGGHLVMAGRLIDHDPELAREHAQAAVRRAARLGVVREAAGLTAYATARYEEAITEFRAYSRLSGSDAYLAVVADSERGRGHPERAIALARGPRAERLDRQTQIELAIVVAGARRDLGQASAALVGLQLPELRSTSREPSVGRLRYAYADTLEVLGRTEEAYEWFERAAAADPDGDTDAADRAALLSRDR
jgi:tetratricopeptide (TPR) repeat protein